MALPLWRGWKRCPYAECLAWRGPISALSGKLCSGLASPILFRAHTVLPRPALTQSDPALQTARRLIYRRVIWLSFQFPPACATLVILRHKKFYSAVLSKMGPANGACLQFNPSPFRPVIKARGRAARGVGTCFRRAEKEAGKFFQENESAGGRLLHRDRARPPARQTARKGGMGMTPHELREKTVELCRQDPVFFTKSSDFFPV